MNYIELSGAPLTKINLVAELSGAPLILRLAMEHFC